MPINPQHAEVPPNAEAMSAISSFSAFSSYELPTCFSTTISSQYVKRAIGRPFANIVVTR
jgi:hypothetical protein